MPTTVGLTTGEVTSRSSFYSLENTFEYSRTAYPYWALGKANDVLDSNCSKTNEDCCNVLPEIWATDFQEVIQNSTADPPIANGQIAKMSFYIPKFTAEEYPSLAIYYGYQGEANRKFLADTFKRPTTWQQYCDEVSNSRCAAADETAQRPPDFNSTDDERSMYFKEGLFNGYFRATEKNDCAGEKSTTCTGHYVPPNCEWNIYPDSQLYWNDILGLDSSDGPMQPTGGYDYGQIYQVWRAAHATKSHVLVGWYQPELLLEEFFLTDTAFQEVLFPVPTDVCLVHRPKKDARCSEDIKTRRGDERGACDNPVQTLVQLIASSVGQNNDLLPEAEKSPAYDFIKSIRISDLDINRMFQKWLSYGNVDRYGNDARMAVCSWVVDNYDELQWFIPAGYPRELSRQSQYEAWYVTLAQIFGILTGFVAILGMALVFRYRETKVMVFAQPLFLFLILSGFLAVASGASLMAFEPTEKTCIAVTWLINLGYSVELIPVLVKTAAINSLIQSSKKAKRVNISRYLMLVKVFAVTGVVAAYLTVWTVLDPSEPQERRTLHRLDATIVEADLSCASDEPFWRLIAFVWEVLLLVMAAVLAVQSKNILKEFNESNALGIMVYNHFLFMMIRGIFQVMRYGGTFPDAMLAAMMSFNYSGDALVSMLIYVFPKFAEARKNPTSYYQSKISRAVSKWNLSSTDVCDEDLKVLVCTANIGNAEPTQESMEAWIPLRGSCKAVTKFDGKRMREGSFDIIAIGMQESTWSENASKRQSSRKEVSEEDILNAMEEHHTASLREMLQDILGAGYSAVAEDQRGQMRLYVWASNHIVEDITDVQISGANTGIGGVIANKGGIVITLKYKTTRMSFLSAHLAAHEGDVYYKARCDNLKTILRESKTFWSQKLDAAVSSHHMFAMGDLNFRTKFDGDSKHDDNFKRAMHMIDLKDYEGLYEYDELQQGLKAGDFLTGFETLRCDWPPTFKVQREGGVVYKDQRVPSYTDRILFRSGPGLKNNLMPVAYEPCPGFITSDHKPIRGAYKIIPNDISGTALKDIDIRLVFHKMECAGLNAADSNGLSDPYLLFLWDSVDLIAEKRSFKDKIRKLVSGRSWPRTRYIAKTLNPKWEGESVALFAKNVNIGPEAMLFIVAMDADLLALTDDFLGATAINVKDATMMKHGETERVIQFDQNLERGGRPAGRIKFQLDVELTIRKGLFTPLRLGDV